MNHLHQKHLSQLQGKNSSPTQHKSNQIQNSIARKSAPHNVRNHSSFCSKAQIHDPPERSPWPASPSQKLPCPASFAPPPPEPPGDALQLPLHPVPAATAAPQAECIRTHHCHTQCPTNLTHHLAQLFGACLPPLSPAHSCHSGLCKAEQKLVQVW